LSELTDQLNASAPTSSDRFLPEVPPVTDKRERENNNEYDL
jgi:hypothetical protein